MGNIHPNRARNAQNIDAVMLVEAFVFRGNRALGYIGTHFIEIDGITVLKVELGKQCRAIVSVYLGFLGIVICGSIVVVGQVLQPDGAQRNHGDTAGSKRAQDNSTRNAKP